MRNVRNMDGANFSELFQESKYPSDARVVPLK